MPHNDLFKLQRHTALTFNSRTLTLTDANQQFRARNIKMLQEAQQGNKEYMSFLITVILYETKECMKLHMCFSLHGIQTILHMR